MQLITAEKVEKVYTDFCGMSEQKAFQLSYDLEKKQPVLVAYMTAVDSKILNQAEREMLFYLGTLIWQIMLSQNADLPMIKEDTLLDCEKLNLKMASELKEAGKLSFAEVIKSILDNFGQPEVFRYIVAVLLNEEENEESLIRDEMLGILMLNLKTIIDCFDQSPLSKV
jgi:hypothetical protein